MILKVIDAKKSKKKQNLLKLLKIGNNKNTKFKVLILPKSELWQLLSMIFTT